MISRDGGDDDDTPLFRKTKAEETKTKPVREKKQNQNERRGADMDPLWFACFLSFVLMFSVFLGSCDLLFLTNVIHEHNENKDKNIQSESFLSFYTLLCFFVFSMFCVISVLPRLLLLLFLFFSKQL